MYFYYLFLKKGKEREKRGKKYFIVNIFYQTPFHRFSEYSSLVNISHSLGIRLKAKVLRNIFSQLDTGSISEEQLLSFTLQLRELRFFFFSFPFFKFLKAQTFVHVISFRSAYCHIFCIYCVRI